MFGHSRSRPACAVEPATWRLIDRVENSVAQSCAISPAPVGLLRGAGWWSIDFSVFMKDLLSTQTAG